MVVAGIPKSKRVLLVGVWPRLVPPNLLAESEACSPNLKPLKSDGDAAGIVAFAEVLVSGSDVLPNEEGNAVEGWPNNGAAGELIGVFEATGNVKADGGVLVLMDVLFGGNPLGCPNIPVDGPRLGRFVVLNGLKLFACGSKIDVDLASLPDGVLVVFSGKKSAWLESFATKLS